MSMRIKLISKIFLFLLFFGHFNLAFCEESIFTPTSEKMQVLSGQYEYLEDPLGNYTFDQVTKIHDNQFLPLLEKNFGFGYKKVLWIRYSIDFKDYHEPYFFLTQEFERIGELTLFYPTDNTGYQSKQIFESTPVNQRAFAIHDYLFQVPTPKKPSPAVFYMRYNPKGHFLLVDLTWSGQKGLLESINATMLANGLFFGGLIALLLYNSLLLLTMGTRDYLYYIYYLACLIGMFAYVSGFAPILIDSPKIYEPIFGFLGFGSAHGGTLFARHFLSSEKYTPRLDKCIRVFQWITFTCMIAALFLPVGVTWPLMQILSSFSFLLIATAVIRLRQGFKPARYYLAAWSVFYFGLIIFVLGSINIVPVNFYTTYMFNVTSFFEATLFALAVSYQLKLNQDVAAEAKTAFIGMISHELKTPLQAIGSSIDLLSLRMPQSDPAFSRLIEATSRLERQVKDLTDYSILESGVLKFNRAKFDASETVKKIVDEFRPLADKKDLKIITEIENNVVISSDEYRLQQIVNNLLMNSIKYTNKGCIKVNLRVSRTIPAKLIISIKDSGIGIGADHRARIFEPFTQIDQTTTRDSLGMGMGLSIVRSLVSVFNGTINVESELGKGSVFRVSIPVERVEHTVINFALLDDEVDSDRRILLVDDNEEVRLNLKEVLENLGYQCDLAESGKVAIKLAADAKYPAIMLDINMPEMNGFQVAEHIRNTPGPNQTTPIICISASSAKNFSNDQQKYFTCFMEKPVRAKKLESILNKLISPRYRDIKSS